jgi:hypothetical protein
MRMGFAVLSNGCQAGKPTNQKPEILPYLSSSSRSASIASRVGSIASFNSGDIFFGSLKSRAPGR